MNPNPIGDIAVTQADHPKRGHVTRLTWHGWHVDIDDQSVSVPTQPSDGKNIEALATLLNAAYRTLNIPTARRHWPAAAVWSGLSEPLAAATETILRAARALAAAQWSLRSFDIYACTRQAWLATNQRVPHALLITALRAALPQPGASLAEYNDTATRTAILALYDRAIELCRAGHTVSRTTRIA